MAAGRQCARGALWWWLGSVVVFGAGVAVFDDLVYGGPLTSGYRPGEVTFSLGAILPNLRYMPAHLIQAMPMLVLGLAGLAWIGGRWVRLRHTDDDGAAARRDFAVGLALAASWASVWALYAAYSWTASPGLSTLQAARFYVPATRRHLAARRLAGGPRCAPGAAGRGRIGRRRSSTVRAGLLVLPHHAEPPEPRSGRRRPTAISGSRIAPIKRTMRRR